MNGKFILIAIIVIVIGVIISINTGSSEIEVIKLPDNYSWIETFSEELAIVKGKNGKIGFVDENGTETIPCEYDSAFDFSDGVAFVEKGGESFYINKQGVKIINTENTNSYDLPRFYNDRALIKTNDLFGYINKQGEEVIPCEYLVAMPFYSEGLAFVLDKNKDSYFIDIYGDKVIDLYYAEKQAVPFSEGLAVVEKDDEWRLIDKYGNTVTEYIEGYNIPHLLNYSYNCFNDGMLLVTQNKKAGYMNKQGEIIIPCQYEYATKFINGIAVVSKDGKIMRIDKEGNEKQIAEYESVVDNFDDVIIVFDNEKYGCINKDGKEILSCEYDYITEFSEGVATAQKGNDYYILKIKK